MNSIEPLAIPSEEPEKLTWRNVVLICMITAFIIGSIPALAVSLVVRADEQRADANRVAALCEQSNSSRSIQRLNVQRDIVTYEAFVKLASGAPVQAVLSKSIDEKYQTIVALFNRDCQAEKKLYNDSQTTKVVRAKSQPSEVVAAQKALLGTG